jgi:hypothetical protein
MVLLETFAGRLIVSFCSFIPDFPEEVGDFLSS